MHAGTEGGAGSVGARPLNVDVTQLGIIHLGRRLIWRNQEFYGNAINLGITQNLILSGAFVGRAAVVGTA